MSKHSIACQILKQSNVSIYSGNTRILNTDSINIFDTSPLKSKFLLHQKISITNKSIIRLEHYEDVIKMGFQISKKRVQGSRLSWGFMNQKVEYFLVRENQMLPDVGGIPSNHVVEYHTAEGWIRLIGTNSTGKKVFLKNASRGFYDKELDTLQDFENLYEDYIGEISPFTYQEDFRKVKIDEIPILVTNDGKLVCIPDSKDLPKIGIFGKPATGKTLTLHEILDCVVMKWNKRCVVANDGVAFQTKSWSLGWDIHRNREFVKQLEVIGHSTRGLPCCYLFPNSDDLSNVELENDVSYRIALPFKDIILSNPEGFFEGIENLGASGKYLGKLIKDDKGNIRPDGLVYVDNVEDIHRLVNEQEYAEQEKLTNTGIKIVERFLVYKIPSDVVRAKIYTLLAEIYNSKIFDVNTNVNSKWIIQMPDGERQAMYPWKACLYAMSSSSNLSIVPVLVTSNIRYKKYFPSYYRFILNDLFKMQIEDSYVKKNELELWVFIDEIHSLLNHPTILETFRTIMKEGRPNRMAFVYATQYFGDIPEDISLVTDYVISFQQTKVEGQRILENFDFLKHQLKDIKTLPKFHAMIAAKSGSPLVIYDTEGNREIIDDGTPFKGKVFPSVSQHSAPKKEGI